MDPDMVRQQAEAEREALALLRKKPAAAFIPHAIPPDTAQDLAALNAAAALKVQAALPQEEPPAPQAAPVPRREGSSVAAQFGRFLSFGLAGAMLGGGLGIFAANYMHLPADLAKLAIFGPAAFFAGVCAVASFFTKPFQR